MDTAPLAPPVVVDTAQQRCPPPDHAAAAEFQRTTAVPGGSVSRGQAQAWIDALTVSERRKNLTGQRVLDEYERCRGGGTAS